MYAVGMLGSYLTQGVYAVAGPFQPFGGAVDIIVVQQEDGTFKSSPWYVKFGDYQSPFKTRTREKAVDISVNDVPADFHMFLDYNGEAYFEKEIDIDEESIGSQASGASLSSEGGSIVDAATEREVSETNDLWIHGDKDAFSNSSLRSSAVEDIFISESSFGSSSLDNLHNVSEGKKSKEVQEASNALLIDVLSEGERGLSVSTTEMNGLEGSHMHGILIAESSHEVFGKISSENSTEILETTETHSIGYTDSTVNFSSSGNSLSVLQTQESNSTYMEMENTHNSDLIKTFDLNTESQENQSESDLWGKSHSDSVLGAAGINNESNTFTPIVNDNRNLDMEDGRVFIDFKSTDTESDVAVASYDFRQLILEEREEWSVGNVRKNELSTDESEDVVQGSESIDTDVKTSVIIPSNNELSGVESSELEKQVEVEQVSEEATQHEGQQIAASSASSSFRWSLWPLSFRRSKLEKATSADSNHALLATTSITAEFPPPEELTQNNDWPQKTRVRTYVPTSSQLASLNLKDGPNKVTFKTIFGKTEVDARIYLWKWNARIVISDVDGTITKSDVLGQVMPLVGRDWSQYGVTRLFSAIKDNGFQVLFLSARAISQAYLTRKFLLTLKQDGEALPEGPVFISPDGLFPSLYREVIRRAPHEFKISCLEAIRELFPKDVNPFYAGFGNRITDEISYLKVGIPKGKIFIINPKGEVVVDRRVDHKSYTSLHALVDDMFPPMSSHEQEDFNSWNYWKMPLLDIEEEISGKSSKNSKKAKK